MWAKRRNVRVPIKIVPATTNKNILTLSLKNHNRIIANKLVIMSLIILAIPIEAIKEL